MPKRISKSKRIAMKLYRRQLGALSEHDAAEIERFQKFLKDPRPADVKYREHYPELTPS